MDCQFWCIYELVVGVCQVECEQCFFVVEEVVWMVVVCVYECVVLECGCVGQQFEDWVVWQCDGCVEWVVGYQLVGWVFVFVGVYQYVCGDGCDVWICVEQVCCFGDGVWCLLCVVVVECDVVCVGDGDVEIVVGCVKVVWCMYECDMCKVFVDQGGCFGVCCVVDDDDCWLVGQFGKMFECVCEFCGVLVGQYDGGYVWFVWWQCDMGGCYVDVMLYLSCQIILGLWRVVCI